MFDAHYKPKYDEIGAEKAAKCDEWFMQNEELAIKELDQIFAAADKLLQEHEFVDYINSAANSNTGGISITVGAEGAASLHRVLNTFTDGVNGVSNKNMTEHMMALEKLFDDTAATNMMSSKHA